MKVEFFFDCSSPWTYLAFNRIEALCNQYDADLVWKPILVGGVFNAINKSVYERRAHESPIKLKYYFKDLSDWARYQGVDIGMPDAFPVNSVKAMRGVFVAMEYDKTSDYVGAVFKAYWGELKDISREDVLKDVVSKVGLDEQEFFDKISQQEYKDKLRANSDELIERGGFGSPTIYLDGDDMFFGNDRIPLVEARLSGDLAAPNI